MNRIRLWASERVRRIALCTLAAAVLLTLPVSLHTQAAGSLSYVEETKSAALPPVSPVKSVNALTECSSYSTAGGYEMSTEVRKALDKAVSALENEGYCVGFAMVDLSSGQAVSYHIDEEFYSASSIKGPYVVSVVRETPEALKTSYSDIEEAIVNSDNDAYFRIRQTYGWSAFSSFWSSAGNGSFQDVTRYGGYVDYTPRQLLRLWIACEEYFENGEVGAELASLYENPNYSCLHQVLGSSYTTRTKAGWLDATTSTIQASCDAGIIYAGNHPYAVVIMTDVPGDLTQLNSLALAIESCHKDMVSSIN